MLFVYWLSFVLHILVFHAMNVIVKLLCISFSSHEHTSIVLHSRHFIIESESMGKMATENTI